MIKLIAMDFDNTLIGHGKERISPTLLNFFEKFIQKGFYAGIVTGRERWNLHETWLAHGEVWGNRFPNYLIAREAYIFRINNGEYDELTDYNTAISEKISKTVREVASHLETILHELEKDGILIQNWFVYSDFAVEIRVANDYDRAMEVIRDVLMKLHIKNVAVHRNVNLITIYHQSAGKGNTLNAFAQSLAIKPDEVLAIGDSLNDLSMIDSHLGFVGACVGNADDAVKQTVLKNGGYVGKGVAFEGILDIINQIVTEGRMQP